MKFNDLKGKTIESVELIKHPKYDDESLKLTFFDGSAVLIIPGYGDYTGNSIGEYPTYIALKTIKKISENR